MVNPAQTWPKKPGRRTRQTHPTPRRPDRTRGGCRRRGWRRGSRRARACPVSAGAITMAATSCMRLDRDHVFAVLQGEACAERQVATANVVRPAATKFLSGRDQKVAADKERKRPARERRRSVYLRILAAAFPDRVQSVLGRTRHASTMASSNGLWTSAGIHKGSTSAWARTRHCARRWPQAL